MARGNQREKAREKNLKAQAAQLSVGRPPFESCFCYFQDIQNENVYIGWRWIAKTDSIPADPNIIHKQGHSEWWEKSKNSKSGSEMQRDKEAVAEMMRKKQAAADAKRAAAGTSK
ncbi:putative serf family protein [Hypomontagnella submonticulosa]|nr:putative serf family protein [Hypomontagnella submonticulosa]